MPLMTREMCSRSQGKMMRKPNSETPWVYACRSGALLGEGKGKVTGTGLLKSTVAAVLTQTDIYLTCGSGSLRLQMAAAEGPDCMTVSLFPSARLSTSEMGYFT